MALKIKAEPIFQGRIQLSCDLSDLNHDGQPEFLADGEAVATIKAVLLDNKGEEVSLKGGSIHFSVNRGLLSRRQVNAEKGVAEVSLRSVAETVNIHVTATAEGYERGKLYIQTVSPEEYESLKEG